MLRFSVVVPAFQAEGTLAETLDAIRRQTFAGWECIVVDDGSTDRTREVADSYAARDGRFHVIHQANGGSASAYNTGVSAARGDLVVICSADDVLLPAHLSRFADAISTPPAYDIYSSNGFYWYPDDSRELVYEPPEGDRAASLALSDVLARCFYSVGATYRRELFEKAGGYRVGVYGEDYDFWLRCMAQGARHRYIPEPLSLHRVSFVQKSARLKTVFTSDITLISDLLRDFRLEPHDMAAADEAIRIRERALVALDHLGVMKGVVRPAVKRALVALLGPRRAWHIVRAVKRVVD